MDEEDEHSPSEFYCPEDLETVDVETETGITECHIINNLLTELAWAVLGNISPRSWQYRPSEARSVLPRPRAKRELKQERWQRQRKRHLKINI